MLASEGVVLPGRPQPVGDDLLRQQVDVEIVEPVLRAHGEGLIGSFGTSWTGPG